MKKKWYEYLWLAEALYWILGLCNILFAWLGMLFFAIPLVMAVAGGRQGLLQPLLRPRAAVGAAGQ